MKLYHYHVRQFRGNPFRDGGVRGESWLEKTRQINDDHQKQANGEMPLFSGDY